MAHFLDQALERRMRRVLITGGAGFIGSHLAEAALARGDQVTVIDSLSTGRQTNLTAIAGRPDFRFVVGRVEDEQRLRPLVAEVDTVFHLAATVGVFNVVQHPVATIENNVGGTAAVLRAAVVGGQRVIVTSTSEVYGKSLAAPFREDADLVLGSSQQSRWSYATSKLIDEFLGLAYFRQHQLPVVVVRPFNTIGPRQVGHYGMVVPRFLSQALANEPITVFGTGQQTRCFTYVTDVVEWLLRLADSETAVGEVFNLGNPHEVSIEALAQQVISLTGSTAGIRHVPYAEAYGPGYEDMDRRVPDISKVVQVTGYAPQIDLATALVRTRDDLLASQHPQTAG